MPLLLTGGILAGSNHYVATQKIKFDCDSRVIPYLVKTCRLRKNSGIACSLPHFDFLSRPTFCLPMRKLLFLLSFAAAALSAGMVSAENLPAGSSVQSPAADAVSAPSMNPWLRFEGKPVVRVGIVKFVRPAPNEEIVDATVAALTRFFGKEKVIVSYLSISELRVAILSGEVDVFLSSAGFFRRMTPYGARDLATAVSKKYPDPNHSDGAAMVVSAARDDLKTLRDLKGKTLATSTPRAFTGLLVPQWEIFSHGENPEKFFSKTLYLGDGSSVVKALPLLRTGEADVVFARLCLLEEWLAHHPEEKGLYSVINRKDTPEKPEACARSTDLYPTWTMATTKVTDPAVSRLVTRALLQMAPVGSETVYWGVATDYSAIDRIYKDLKSGPYAYLRSWTVHRFLEENWQWLIIVLFGAAGLIFHSVRVTQLVRERTADLRRALQAQKVLQTRERDAAERVEKLEKAGVIAQLSVIFAHEMRQPLGAISLYSFALRKLVKSKEPSEEKMTAVLAKLDEQTARANDIVTRVRSYAKSEAPQRRPIKLISAVRHAVADLKTTGRYSAEVRLVSNANPTVCADELEMELVAINLIKNALQALAEEGPGGSVLVTVDESDEHALLTVSDSGTRVTDETVARLMTSLESTKAEGLGLGLSIVRGILEAHGGRLTYARRETGGLIAMVTVPRYVPDPEDNEPEVAGNDETK